MVRGVDQLFRWKHEISNSKNMIMAATSLGSSELRQKRWEVQSRKGRTLCQWRLAWNHRVGVWLNFNWYSSFFEMHARQQTQKIPNHKNRMMWRRVFVLQDAAERNQRLLDSRSPVLFRVENYNFSFRLNVLWFYFPFRRGHSLFTRIRFKVKGRERGVSTDKGKCHRPSRE